MLYLAALHVASLAIFLGLAAKAPVIEDPDW